MSTTSSRNDMELSELESDRVEKKNKEVVDGLYKALEEGSTRMVSTLLASDLEWWFHGPPLCQHMMRVLTGESTHCEFRFVPRDIQAIADICVITEGWEGAKIYWVHVWTVKDGLITQLREYFNTWLIVKGVKPHAAAAADDDQNNHLQQQQQQQQQHTTLTLWQSQPRDLFNRSLPSVLLAI